MDEGIESRIIIHEILKSIKLKSLRFDNIFLNKTYNTKLSPNSKRFIHNAVLTSLRNFILINKIIKKLVRKIDFNSDAYFLLLSSICQIIFLNIKEYAVVNSAVEISKNKKYNTSSRLINGTLRNLIRQRNKLKKIEMNFTDLPSWFLKQAQNLSDEEKNIFLKNISLQPTLHLVFNNKQKMEKYLKYGKKTSNFSIAVNKEYSFSDIPNYNKGDWWVQDFSSMLPLSLINIENINQIADVGSAPGGKLLQLLSKNKSSNISVFEKNMKKIAILNKNLERLNFNNKYKSSDFLDFNKKNFFDMIVIDAPCSALGTIRRHPEIFFRKEPNFKSLLKTQYLLLEKAANSIKKNGFIIYMVCSFLKIETLDQVDKFLKNNDGFKIEKFDYEKNSLFKNYINKGFFLTLPNKIIKDIQIDGYFAIKIFKND